MKHLRAITKILKQPWLFSAIGVMGFVLALAFYLLDIQAAIGPTITSAISSFAISAACSKHFKGLAFTGWVLAFVTCAFFYPSIFISWGDFKLEKTIVPLVQLILFGMGMTLSFDDFLRVAKMPKGIIIGFTLQYTVMPIMGFTFAHLFGLKAEVAAGLILIGSCPGGVASNVIAYLAGANVALSVTMTACSTLLSPLMTPLAMELLASQEVPVEFWDMMTKILEMIILPLVVGILINRYAHWLAKKLVKILPFIAMLSICIIIAITIALSRNDLLKVALALFGASVCHNATGYTLGYWCAKLSGLNKIDSRTVALEVGIQNGGMATGLAFKVLKSPLAAMGSAVFGPWTAVTSSALASYWRNKKTD
ncbi:MAG: bile acid:sodium symporter family protein [Planctomycetota bacterium]|jgi:BASS family bile acid:Na+ symporter